jgi:hypothetical protein
MVGYQPQTLPRYARRIGQEAAPLAPGAPPAPAPAPMPAMAAVPFIDWNREEVKTAAVAQGVALAYALTAGFFYNKRGDFVNRVILGVGSLAFGVASWASYRLMAAKPSNTVTQVTGGVFGTLDAVTALGSLVATFRPKKTAAGQIAESIADALPV